jgi:hypothetical protein
MVMKSLPALLATTILLAGFGASDAAARIVEDPAAGSKHTSRILGRT